MSTTDGREHARLRKLITPAFTPRRVDAMRPQIEAVVTGLLDELESRPGDEPTDLHAAFSYPVPTEMICNLFGVPPDQRAEVLRILRVVVATDVDEEESLAINDDMMVAMRELIDDRRRDPGEDLTSFLLAAREQGEDPLSEHELISTLLLMLRGGSSTTIALIDHTVRELLAHPEQLGAVLADPARWTEVIEESLRVQGTTTALSATRFRRSLIGWSARG